MQAPSLMEQGIQMMAFGMGTVFVFLTLLIFATKTMSHLVLRYFPEKQSEAPISQAKAEGENHSPALIAAITAAVHAHRSKRD